jgi:formylglycine-generating enzyme required for sulfatase activity
MRVSPALRTCVIFCWLAVGLLTAAPVLNAEESSPVRLDLGGGQSLELVPIKPGTFQQGSPANEAGRGGDETLREVTLTKPFLLGKSPVNRGQFARFVAETHYRTDAETGPSGGFGWDGTKLSQRKEFTWRNPGFTQTDDHPVVMLTYRDAEAFLRWLSRKTGRTFALPSEAQWEYAARARAANGGGGDSWNLGNSGSATHAVGEKPLNAWGLADMTGNVWEWCADWYAPYSADSISDPLQSDSTLSDKPRRVLRGGSWLREKKFCRPAARYRNDPLSRNADNGFRVMTFQMNAAASVPPAATIPFANSPSSSNAATKSVATDQPGAMTTSSTSFSYDSSTGRSSSLFGWLLAVPFLIFGFVVIAIIRKLRGAIFSNMGGVGSAPGNILSMAGLPIRVRIANDGFWIVGDNVAAGTPMSCSYDAGNGMQQLDVRYEPSPQGQFVFTGAQPSKVTVSMNRGTSPFRSVGGGTIIPNDRYDSSPTFSGHPSAY